MTSDLTSATLITLVSMCILPPMASEAIAASEVTSNLKIQLSDLDYICYHAFLASNGLYGLNQTGTLIMIR